jgi:hypothetical protein
MTRAVDPGTNEVKEEQMRKLTYALAAAATLAIGAPTIANAAGFGVYVGGGPGYYGERYDGPHVRYHGHDRGVVIRQHHWDD